MTFCGTVMNFVQILLKPVEKIYITQNIAMTKFGSKMRHSLKK